VINLAIALRRGVKWDTALYLPPNLVSPSERSQIASRLQAWAEALEVSAKGSTLTQSSNIPLPPLSKPLRPFFLHPSSSIPPHIPADPPYTPILCLSASRWVGPGSMDEIPSVTGVESGTVGFEYVQGAGDDDELWARVSEDVSWLTLGSHACGVSPA
jgi:tRNA A64-2'-O-ribosylphosphate transferase